jgi:hypothetical protein
MICLLRHPPRSAESAIENGIPEGSATQSSTTRFSRLVLGQLPCESRASLLAHAPGSLNISPAKRQRKES